MTEEYSTRMAIGQMSTILLDMLDGKTITIGEKTYGMGEDLSVGVVTNWWDSEGNPLESRIFIPETIGSFLQLLRKHRVVTIPRVTLR